MTDMINPDNKPIKLQREEAIKKLEHNFAHGHLEVEEFESRLDLALNTTLPQDLARITADLAVIPVNLENSSDIIINTGKVRSEELFLSILSGVERKGVWKPARKNKLFTLMGGMDLDFSEAIFPPGVTEIEFLCLMGGVDIIVPNGINIEVKGLPIMGGIDKKVSDEHYPGSPTLRISGIVLMGGIDIKHPKRKKRRWGR
ncbi:MAG: DUF1707 and DUF2154 domain-containing protein [Spirochaetales bacterium]|nr:DUF1707 and DUF2154 domain-containing protein [Spirochaetales bacterium]